jgi:hypothetical protein
MIMLRMMVVAMLLTGPAWAGCPPKDYLSIPKVIGLKYPEARAALMKAGFQPLLDWERMRHDYKMEAEAWIAETAYFEVQACSNMESGACRANFVDNYRNLLRIVTENPAGAGHQVAHALFVCGSEAANVFGRPSDY